MRNLIKTFTLLAFPTFCAISTYGQAQKYLTFGGAGTGLYASIEFPVASRVSLAPQVSTDYNFNKLVLAGKGNFYFDDIFGVNDSWDVYAGANVGWRIDNGNDGVAWGVHIGGRWFWSEKWGLNVEIGGGSGVLGGVGVTRKL